MPHAGHAANPLCADAFDVGIVVEGGVIVDAAFAGGGCALATGSASLLCTWILGKRVEEVRVTGLAHLEGETVGRMREGCVTVSTVALERALQTYASR